MIQTDSFREFCAFMQNKTGSKQAWSKRYRDTWNEYLLEYGIEVMVGLLLDREFSNVEYAIKAFEMLDGHEQTLYIQCISREKYWEYKKLIWAREFEANPNATELPEGDRRAGPTDKQIKAALKCKEGAPDD